MTTNNVVDLKDNQFLIQSFLETRRSKSTKDMYKYELNRFLQFINNKPLIEVEKWDMSEYNKYLKQQYDNEKTLQRIYTTLRVLFDWMVDMDIIEKNPTKGPIKPLTPKSNPNSKLLSVEEIEALRDVAFPNARDYALITLLATTGLRINELSNMDWKDVVKNSNGEAMAHVVRKGGEECYVPLLPSVVDALNRYRATVYDGSDTAPIFGALYRKQYKRITDVGLRKIITALAKKAGIDKAVSPHWLRHTFASQTLNNGAGLRNVQNALNHKSIKTTELYLHPTVNDVAKYLQVDFSVESVMKAINSNSKKAI